MNSLTIWKSKTSTIWLGRCRWHKYSTFSRGSSNYTFIHLHPHTWVSRYTNISFPHRHILHTNSHCIRFKDGSRITHTWISKVEEMCQYTFLITHCSPNKSGGGELGIHLCCVMWRTNTLRRIGQNGGGVMRHIWTAPKRPCQDAEKMMGGWGQKQPGRRGPSEREGRHVCICVREYSSPVSVFYATYIPGGGHRVWVSKFLLDCDRYLLRKSSNSDTMHLCSRANTLTHIETHAHTHTHTHTHTQTHTHTHTHEHTHTQTNT